MSEHEELALYGESALAQPGEWLTAQFYAWEKRGRGWQVSSQPVELEPPFMPFLFHALPSLAVVDDARKPTLLSALVAAVKSSWARSQPTAEPILPPNLDFTADLVPFLAPEQLRELEIALPPELRASDRAAEQFLLSLSHREYPISFELVADHERMSLQFACADVDTSHVSGQLQAFFPECTLVERGDTLASAWQHRGASIVVEFGLSHEFMRPLKLPGRFEVDPLLPIVGALSSLRGQESAVLQVLLQRARYPWAESCLRAMSDWEGRPFFADAPEMVSLTREKVSRPLFACLVRVAAQSAHQSRTWDILRQIAAGFAQFGEPLSNEFIPLSNEDYDDQEHLRDLLQRQTRRCWLLLNSAELASLVHLPSSSVRSPKLRREMQKTKAAPASTQKQEFLLGENLHQGKKLEVTLRAAERLQHMYVIGASGTGKSTLLLNLIVQDLERGSGFAVLDPHGDLIEQILARLPDKRMDDAIIFDPADADFPVRFNILSAHSELEKNLLASDLVAVFRRLSSSWGDQMTSVLGNAILAFLESTRGGTLADLRRFLVEPEFRREFLRSVDDATVRYFWEREFPLLAGRPQAPLLTRLDAFLRPKLVRNLVTQNENRMDFAEIMNQGKVFLAKLAQGAIGEENAYLLGSFLVSKFHQVALSRQELDHAQRRPFYLYVDEFHNFMTPSMASILSGARKYGLGLVLAHQDLRQLWERDSAVASAVISNANTRLCFRVGDFDARKLSEGFSFFNEKDLQNLGLGEAICRIERADFDFNLRTLPVPPVDGALAKERRERALALSRDRYACGPVGTEQTPAEPTHEATIPRKALRAEKRAAERISTPQPSTVKTESRPDALAAMGKPAMLGRGGAQHRYLQQLVKRLAEARGWRAIIEQPVLGGIGLVDVALERDTAKIACEISVTSTDEYEVQNARKCLAAGFDQVALIAADRRGLNRLTAALATALDPQEHGKVLALLPDEFVTFLEEQAAVQAPREDVVRGYKVKVQYKSGTREEKSTRKQAISHVILGALQRLKGGKGK